MAKSTKKKSEGNKPELGESSLPVKKEHKLKAVRGSKKEDEDVPPLSEFQNTELTGRTDPGEKKGRKKAAAEPPAEEEKPAAIVKKNQISIERVKIFDDHFLTISYSRIDKKGGHSDHPGERYPDRYMHDDLRNAFAKLKVHLAYRCGFIRKDEIKSTEKYAKELISGIKVTGISVKAGEGVVITGLRKTEEKDVVIVNTPFTRFEHGNPNSYRFAEDLTRCVDELLAEAQLYLENKKVGEDPQGKLFDDELDADPADEPYSEADL